MSDLDPQILQRLRTHQRATAERIESSLQETGRIRLSGMRAIDVVLRTAAGREEVVEIKPLVEIKQGRADDDFVATPFWFSHAAALAGGGGPVLMQIAEVKEAVVSDEQELAAAFEEADVGGLAPILAKQLENQRRWTELALAEMRQHLSASVRAAVMEAVKATTTQEGTVVARARPEHVHAETQQPNPQQPLGVSEVAKRLGISDEAVRQREKADELYAVLPAGRQRGRLYPAFQLLPEVVGEPMRRVLAKIKPIGGATAAARFFDSTPYELWNLSPVEVLCGSLLRERAIEPAAQALLDLSVSERREAVVNAAEAYAADLNAG